MCTFGLAFVNLVWQIAFAAIETGHTELLGVLYDELVRAHWQSISLKTRNFRLRDEVVEVNKAILEKAKSLHEKLLGSAKVAQTQASSKTFM